MAVYVGVQRAAFGRWEFDDTDGDTVLIKSKVGQSTKKKRSQDEYLDTEIYVL